MTPTPLHLFCHVPKTGGSTVTRVLVESLGLRYVAARPVNGRITYSNADLRRDLRVYPWARCVGGHALKPHAGLTAQARDIRWVTLLREPVARYVSHYQHQYDRSHQRYRVPLDEWQRKFDRSNLMVRSIAGEPNLERAKELLDRFEVVGRLEALDDFLAALQARNLLRSELGAAAATNVAPNTSVSERIYGEWERHEALITESNALDISLYEHVLSLSAQAQVSNVHGPVDLKPARVSPSLKTKVSRAYRTAVHRPVVRLGGLLEAGRV